MPSAFRLLAPAKLNLYLRVVGRRPDSYHELETLFERIDLADELAFTLQPSGVTLTCDDASLDCGPTNLVTRAARLLQGTTGTEPGAEIHLIKRIPIASGLGGGSSDAATTLIGLNRLWELGLSRQSLRELGAQLGSDVPFFLEEAAFAIGRGRGEQCEPLPGPTLWHVVVVPPERLSTAQIYQGFDAQGGGLTGRAPSITIAVHALRNGSVDELAAGLYNDLGPEAIRRCPIMQSIQTVLREHRSVGTLVSGSGSAVFGLYQSPSHAQQAAVQLRGRCPAAWQIAAATTQRTPATPIQNTTDD